MSDWFLKEKSVEIKFDEKPDRAKLYEINKSKKLFWSPKNKVWYGRFTNEAQQNELIEIARSLTGKKDHNY